jgi:hypothetical protein
MKKCASIYEIYKFFNLQVENNLLDPSNYLEISMVKGIILCECCGRSNALETKLLYNGFKKIKSNSTVAPISYSKKYPNEGIQIIITFYL